MNRRQARIQAFKLIFEIQFQTDCIEEIINRFKENNVDNNQLDYILNVSQGVFNNSEKIDALITQNLTESWKMSRLSKVSLAILRLAIYEMQYIEDVTAKVAINEAVELAKTFDADNAPAFINGVLGGVNKCIGDTVLD